MPPPAPTAVTADRVLLIGRNGAVLRDEGAGVTTDAVVAELLPARSRLARRAITGRSAQEIHVPGPSGRLELRASPLGPDRALCVVREVGELPADGGGSWLARAAFLNRLQADIDDSRLRERALAVAVRGREAERGLGAKNRPGCEEALHDAVAAAELDQNLQFGGRGRL